MRQDGTRFPIELDFKTFENDEGVFLVAVIVDLESRGRERGSRRSMRYRDEWRAYPVSVSASIKFRE